MKITKIQKWLLLEQSGELTVKQQKKLARALSASADARQMRDALNALRGAASPVDPELSPWTVSTICARLRTENRSARGAMKVLRPALLVAACLIGITVAFNFHEKDFRSTSTAVVATVAEVYVWNVPNEEDLVELENLMVAISSDPLEFMEM